MALDRVLAVNAELSPAQARRSGMDLLRSAILVPTPATIQEPTHWALESLSTIICRPRLPQHTQTFAVGSENGGPRRISLTAPSRHDGLVAPWRNA